MRIHLVQRQQSDRAVVPDPVRMVFGSVHELGSDRLCLRELVLSQRIIESTTVGAPLTHSSASSLLAQMRLGLC